jgi:hypothetical protein
MEKNIAILALKKAEEQRKRRNEMAKKMRERRGDELKEKQREYAKIHREKKKKEIQDALEAINKEPDNQDNQEKPKVLLSVPVQKDVIKIEKNDGELISRAEKTGIKGVSEKTADDYISKINIIHKIISKKELDKKVLKKILMGKNEDCDSHILINNMEYIEDIDKVIKTIEDKYDNLKSRKVHISSFITLVSYLPTIHKDNYDKIRKKFEEINNEIHGIRITNDKNENIVINPNAEKFIDSFEEKDIIQNTTNIDANDTLIYLFYTLQPPRRYDDVYLIHIKKIASADEVDYDKLDNGKNYIIVDSDNNPREIVYNKYKTINIYGKKSIIITNNNLKNAIKTYILAHFLKDGDKLFNKYNSPTTFNAAIKRIFSKIYNKNITLNKIRNSYIIWELRTIRSVNYISNLASMMGHSTDEQKLYKIA